MTDRLTMRALEKRVDKIESDQGGHEDECAIRYNQLNDSISDLKDGQKWAIRLSVVTLLGVAGKVIFGG